MQAAALRCHTWLTGLCLDKDSLWHSEKGYLSQQNNIDGVSCDLFSIMAKQTIFVIMEDEY